MDHFGILGLFLRPGTATRSISLFCGFDGFQVSHKLFLGHNYVLPTEVQLLRQRKGRSDNFEAFKIKSVI